MPLSKEQRARYSRHLLLPEIGEAGQQRLQSARVLIVGAGGLGSPAALYLAAAGVGTLGIIDNDRVDISNLQRQVLFDTNSVGLLKAEQAQARLTALNPDITVLAHPVELRAGNAREILSGYDIVLDGSDRLSTRYLVNDACVNDRGKLPSRLSRGGRDFFPVRHRSPRTRSDVADNLRNPDLVDRRAARHHG